MEPESCFGCPTYVLREEFLLKCSEWLSNEELQIVARVSFHGKDDVK